MDSRTRLLEIGNGDFYDQPMENFSNGSYRLGFNQKTQHFGVGDLLVYENGYTQLKACVPAGVSNSKGFFGEVPVGTKLSNPPTNGVGMKIMGAASSSKTTASISIVKVFPDW